MTKSDRLVEELGKILDQVYREQPDMMGPVKSLVGLLTYAFCEHEWENKRIESQAEPTELITVCKKCGSEKLE